MYHLYTQRHSANSSGRTLSRNLRQHSDASESFQDVGRNRRKFLDLFLPGGPTRGNPRGANEKENIRDKSLIIRLNFFLFSGPTGSISGGANKNKDKDKKIILFSSQWTD